MKGCHPRISSLRLLILTTLILASTPANAGTALDVFDETAALVEERFFDPDMNGLDWDTETATVRQRLTPFMNREDLATEINGLLNKLGASHTRFFTQDDPQWYQLVGVFVDGWAPLAEALAPYLSNGAPVYTGIGVMLEKHEQGHFVSGVLDGFPAAGAGLLVGDRIVSVEEVPFHPIRSFAGMSGREVRLNVERRPGEMVDVVVVPRRIDGRNMFEEALRASVRVVETDGLEIGYVRAWSYAGRRYQDIVAGALTNGALKDTDAVVLDIRGGWGGADPSYLNRFTDSSITATATMRDGTQNNFSSGWSRPVVLLADDGSRSGKELLTHGFRALGKGPIVGETTAGAVLSGQINALSDGSVLYVAVADIHIDGERLEGQGVPPDIEVPFDVPYAAGADPQLDRAVSVAADQVTEASSVR